MKKITIMFLILILQSSCKLENINFLKGDQTFKCQKDGEDWVSYVGINFVSIKNAVCFFDDNNLRITAGLFNNQGFKEQKFNINLKKFKGKGVYEIDSSKLENYLNFIEVGDGDVTIYEPYQNEIGEIKITQINYKDGTVCGKFKIKLKERSGTKIINVTQGFFDLHIVK